MSRFKFNDIAKQMVKNIEKASYIIATDWHKESDKYTPEDTGNLKRNVVFGNSKTSGGKTTTEWAYLEKYAPAMFFGFDLEYNRAKKPQARPLWTDKSALDNKNRWQKFMADSLFDGLK